MQFSINNVRLVHHYGQQKARGREHHHLRLVGGCHTVTVSSLQGNHGSDPSYFSDIETHHRGGCPGAHFHTCRFRARGKTFRGLRVRENGNSRGAHRCSHALSASSTAGQATSTISPEPPSQVAALEARALEQSSERVRHLENLVLLRKLYRNLLRAEGLLTQPSPVYQPSSNTNGDATPAVMGDVDDEYLDEEEERRSAAVEVVAELQLTAEQIRAYIRLLSTTFANFGEVFGPGEHTQAEETILKQSRDIAGQLEERARLELDALPFASLGEAQAALDARNLKYRVDDPKEKVSTRFEKAEKAVERFVARRLQPAVQKVREVPFKSWVVGAKAFWVRLNGGGQRSSGIVPGGLAMPQARKEERQAAVAELSQAIDGLEKRLQEASKAREARLRNASIPQRARMAFELRNMDEEIEEITRSLAVRTLQLEMVYVFGGLEDEALDIAQGTRSAGFLLFRQGSSDELALLVAEYALLDGQLAAIAAATDRGDANKIPEDLLMQLASEVPDLRTRLGIVDSTVFSSSNFTWVRFKGSISEAVAKVQEGATFFSRGFRLLGSDINSAGRLVYRVALGVSLKPREVIALRRTARDLLTFIPFTIILITPLTPVGHVLIFGFLQRYFPGFFPSQFSNRRQELMQRYEELRKQLIQAQAAAEEKDEVARLERAAAAVARLTAPSATAADARRLATLLTPAINSPPPHQKGSLDGDDSDAPSPDLQRLERKVAEAAQEVSTGSIDDDDKP